ncbi:MAG: beta-galactosidase, partial [Armatimonadetes bacterium]|nr:beta-galactosidase [Armatimonadota bacterium]
MKAVLFLVISAIVILTPLAFSANDRPLIFGQNPIPTNWWGYDKNTYDPVEFDKMQQSGCSSARIGVNWDQIEPTRGIRSWGEIDRWVKLCVDRGINPVILINGTPTWALPD